MVHVCIELTSGDGIPIAANETIWRVLANKHQCSGKVWYFSVGMLDGYMFQETVARYTFRDDVFLGRLKRKILHVVESPNPQVQIELTDDNDDGSECETCFPAGDRVIPLDYESFDLIHQWLLDVPLNIQLLLQQFINLRTLERTPHRSSVLQQKCQLLYSVYDILLHVVNRKYFGIFQIANSDELLMGYKSIETVFNVTTGAGSSTSLCVAEKRLKKRANKDDLYYAIYLLSTGL
jgi:hypothetical protein